MERQHIIATSQLHDYHHMNSNDCTGARNVVRGYRSRRHSFRRPYPAWPLHGRARALQRAQARLTRDRRCAGTGNSGAGTDRRDLHGQRPAGRTGPGTGASGCARGKTAGCNRCNHRQQSVRFRHEGHHARSRYHQGRLGRDRPVRRHGEHEQRSVSAGQSAYRLSRRPRSDHRSHDD